MFFWEEIGSENGWLLVSTLSSCFLIENKGKKTSVQYTFAQNQYCIYAKEKICQGTRQHCALILDSSHFS